MGLFRGRLRSHTLRLSATDTSRREHYHLQSRSKADSMIDDKQGARVLAIVHQRRNEFLAASPFGKNPDQPFWASCHNYMKEDGLECFESWVKLRDWVQKPRYKHRNIEELHAQRQMPETRMQELTYEWIPYWRFRDIRILVAKLQDSIINLWGRGMVTDILGEGIVIPDNEEDFIPWILSDGIRAALEGYEKSLKVRFRKTRNYSLHSGERNSDESMSEYDDEFDASSPVNDPNPLDSIEIDHTDCEDLEADGNVANDLGNTAITDEMSVRSPSPQTSNLFREYEIAYYEKFFPEVRRHSSSLPRGVGEPSRDPSHGSQLEERDKTDGRLDTIKTMTPEHSSKFKHESTGGKAIVRSPSPSPAADSPEIRPPKSFAEMLESANPKFAIDIDADIASVHGLDSRQQSVLPKLDELHKLQRSTTPSYKHDFNADIPLDVLGERVETNGQIRASERVPTDLHGPFHESVRRTVEDDRVCLAAQEQRRRQGTDPLLRRENEQNARNRSKRTRIHLPQVEELKALLVQHQPVVPAPSHRGTEVQEPPSPKISSGKTLMPQEIGCEPVNKGSRNEAIEIAKSLSFPKVFPWTWTSDTPASSSKLVSADVSAVSRGSPSQDPKEPTATSNSTMEKGSRRGVKTEPEANVDLTSPHWWMGRIGRIRSRLPNWNSKQQPQQRLQPPSLMTWQHLDIERQTRIIKMKTAPDWVTLARIICSPLLPTTDEGMCGETSLPRKPEAADGSARVVIDLETNVHNNTVVRHASHNYGKNSTKQNISIRKRGAPTTVEKSDSDDCFPFTMPTQDRVVVVNDSLEEPEPISKRRRVQSQASNLSDAPPLVFFDRSSKIRRTDTLSDVTPYERGRNVRLENPIELGSMHPGSAPARDDAVAPELPSFPGVLPSREQQDERILLSQSNGSDVQTLDSRKSNSHRHSSSAPFSYSRSPQYDSSSIAPDVFSSPTSSARAERDGSRCSTTTESGTTLQIATPGHKNTSKTLVLMKSLLAQSETALQIGITSYEGISQHLVAIESLSAVVRRHLQTAISSSQTREPSSSQSKQRR